MIDIKVYGSESCGKCKIIIKKLNDKNIGVYYSMDKEEVLDMAEKFNTRELPICVVDGEYKSYMEMNKWIRDM